MVEELSKLDVQGTEPIGTIGYQVLLSPLVAKKSDSGGLVTFQPKIRPLKDCILALLVHNGIRRATPEVGAR